MNNKVLHMVAFILLVIGGVNWLLYGTLEIDLVAKIFGSGSVLAKAVYVLVGLSAIYELAMHKKFCRTCSGEM